MIKYIKKSIMEFLEKSPDPDEKVIKIFLVSLGTLLNLLILVFVLFLIAVLLSGMYNVIFG